MHEVSKAYKSGTQQFLAVEQVNLEILRGEVFGLIGHSGAGKSTLLRCINLLERPTSGTVTVDDVQLTALNKRQLQRERAKMGMIFQHFHLLHSATVKTNIAFPLKLARRPRTDINQRVAQLLDLVHLSGYEDKYPSQLSGGQKQRVAIARALANEPKVLLCDEATSALDPMTTSAILDLLLEINRRLSLTIVIVTHEMAVVQRVCDRVAVISHGRVVESGPIADVFLTPTHEVTQGLLADTKQISLPKWESTDYQPGALLEISYVGNVTYAPILAQVAQETKSTFSILKGVIDTLKETPYGRLTVAWFGTDEQAHQAMLKLQRRGCSVKKLDIGVLSSQLQGMEA